jgi:hypothetical protein
MDVVLNHIDVLGPRVLECTDRDHFQTSKEMDKNEKVVSKTKKDPKGYSLRSLVNLNSSVASKKSKAKAMACAWNHRIATLTASCEAGFDFDLVMATV